MAAPSPCPLAGAHPQLRDLGVWGWGVATQSGPSDPSQSAAVPTAVLGDLWVAHQPLWDLADPAPRCLGFPIC